MKKTEEEREMRELAEKIVAEHGDEVNRLIDGLLNTKSDSWWKAMGLENAKKELEAAV